MLYIKWKQFSALLAICAGNSPVTGEFPAQRPVTRSFDIFFDLRLNKRLSKQLNNGEAGDLRRHRTNYDVTVLCLVNYLYVFTSFRVYTSISRSVCLLLCNIAVQYWTYVRNSLQT